MNYESQESLVTMEYLTKEMKEGLREMARIYIKWAADDKPR